MTNGIITSKHQKKASLILLVLSFDGDDFASLTMSFFIESLSVSAQSTRQRKPDRSESGLLCDGFLLLRTHTTSFNKIARHCKQCYFKTTFQIGLNKNTRLSRIPRWQKILSQNKYTSLSAAILAPCCFCQRPDYKAKIVQGISSPPPRSVKGLKPS